jgi:hypothetical protein
MAAFLRESRGELTLARALTLNFLLSNVLTQRRQLRAGGQKRQANQGLQRIANNLTLFGEGILYLT